MHKPYIPLLLPIPQASLTALEQYGTYGFVLEMNGDGTVTNADALAHCISGGRPFVLLCHSGLQLRTAATDLISICMFSKNYIRMEGAPVIAFYGTDDTQDNNRRTQLVKKLQLQGWPTINEWTISGESFGQQLMAKKPSPLLMEQLDVDGPFLSTHFFSIPDYMDGYTIFKADSLDAAARLEQDFYRLCIAEMQRDSLLMTYLTLKRSSDALTAKHAVLQERLNNANTTIAVIRNKYKDDYDNLFKWYHNEYEVLPLWYKRFGQVIKVIMGKRTLLSLFSDTEKKYKD